MTDLTLRNLTRRETNSNIWLGYPTVDNQNHYSSVQPVNYEVLTDEEAVGKAMFAEIERAANEKTEDLVVILLGGRGAQAMYRHINKLSQTGAIDNLLNRLHVFTQDALAPMRMNNGLSFVRDFERLLGESFFSKIKSFTPMQTDTNDLEGEMMKYLEKLESLGGIDIFFLGLGPEANAASHLAYIKPHSGATANDLAGIIPISSSILEHHINKFKVGGSQITQADEAECRAATHILTLAPAAILGAKRIVQSIVDAGTAPAKRESFKRVNETEFAPEKSEFVKQFDENPGLWLRIHPNVRTLILSDLL